DSNEIWMYDFQKQSWVRDTLSERRFIQRGLGLVVDRFVLGEPTASPLPPKVVYINNTTDVLPGFVKQGIFLG
ncbi:MAG: hypothetical protein U9Q67_04635, partial [Patescibacteria group bacterium]|nr:hypothetical protein [Patescibacteria group bacterium]